MAILVLKLTEGITAQTHELLLLARQMGVQVVLPFLNCCDQASEPAQIEGVTTAVQEALSAYGFHPIDPIQCGAELGLDGDLAAQHTIIDQLVKWMDHYAVVRPTVTDQPFFMPIANAAIIVDRRLMTMGRVERGRIIVGARVAVVGSRPTWETVVTGLAIHDKSIDQGCEGDNISLRLRHGKIGDVALGDVLATPGTVTAHDRFTAEVYIPTAPEGGLAADEPFLTAAARPAAPAGPAEDAWEAVCQAEWQAEESQEPYAEYKERWESWYKENWFAAQTAAAAAAALALLPKFYIRTAEVRGVAHLPAGVTQAAPGSTITMTIELNAPAVIEPGLRFVIREANKTVGLGTVSALLA